MQRRRQQHQLQQEQQQQQKQQQKLTVKLKQTFLSSLHNNNMILLLLILFLNLPLVVIGTDIKWTPASNTNAKGGKVTAETAPKSQKYWDEHNIERPDYAKTDYEIALERTNSLSTNTKVFLFVLSLLVIGSIIFWYLQKTNRCNIHNYGGKDGIRGYIFPSGTRLGSDSNNNNHHPIGTFLSKFFSKNSSSSSSSSSLTAEEEARNARLARFDQQHNHHPTNQSNNTTNLKVD